MATKLEKQQIYVNSLLEELYRVMQHNEELRAQKAELANKTAAFYRMMTSDE